MPDISIKKNIYTMAVLDNNVAEVTMYGDIVEQTPTDWWGDPIKGDFITQEEFLADLDKISSAKEIVVRMNSYGGDAGVSILIHNKLRELAKQGKKITCIVDGVAMSGGSLIMCAADTVKVNPSSLIMIHKAWTFFFGGYNADELRNAATQQDAYDKAQASIYTRKTGLSEDEVLSLMSETTYMTGKEAVERGFADELLEDASLSIAASADGRTLFVNGRQLHLTAGQFAPDIIPTVKPSGITDSNPTEPSVSEEGGIIMNVAELREKYPDLVAQVEAEAREQACADATNNAVQAERDRIRSIEEVEVLFNEELVREAKYGETACSAQELSYRAAKQASQQRTAFIESINADANASGVNGVKVAPNAGETEEVSTDVYTEAKNLAKKVLGNK